MQSKFFHALLCATRQLSSKSKGPHSARRRRKFFSQFIVERLEDRRLLATFYVDDPTGFTVTTDQGAPGLDAGDTVTWNPGPGSAHTGTPVAGLAFGTNAFTSIQAGVDAAPAGSTIKVGSGTFAETVDVNKQLFLLGNQVNVDAQSGRAGAAETIVTGVGATPAGGTPFNISASDVELNGFTIEGASNVNAFGFGILLGAGTSGSEVRNNIVQNNIAGLSLANASATNQTVIEQNLFRNNNLPGPASGTAIYTDQFNAGGPLNNVLIDNNTFTSNDNVAVLIGPTDAASPATNITISNNVMTGNGNGILLFNTINSTVENNEISGSAGSQFVIGGGVNGLTVTGNIIENGATRGIRIGDFGGGGTNQNVTINFNSIQGNPTAGLEIDSTAGAYTGTLDAENNFWGSPNGPTNPNNPGGDGDAIVDPNNQVDFIPFLPSGEDADPETRGFQPVLSNPLECGISTLNSPGSPGSASIEDDADNPGNNVLIVTGTSGNDVIVIEPRPRSQGQFRVIRNGRVIVTFISTAVPRIVAFGMAGNDTITVNASMSQPATLIGGDGNDSLYGGRGDDELDGGRGNDLLFGGLGDDELCGAEGNDILHGSNGNDFLGGDAGNDRLYGEAGNDLAVGGEGNDFLYGSVGNDRLYGQAGNDQIFGDVGNDLLIGGDNNDKLDGGVGRDILIGGLGADSLLGSAHDDILVTGSTIHDADDEALQAILAEWTSSNGYNTRVNNIRNGGGANGAFTLDAATVSDDGVKDSPVVGDGGQDWFWIGLNDKIKDRAGNERVN